MSQNVSIAISPASGIYESDMIFLFHYIMWTKAVTEYYILPLYKKKMSIT